MSPTSTWSVVKRREESDDELPNLLMRLGQSVRGDGGGVVGAGLVHSSFRMLGTPSHVLMASVTVINHNGCCKPKFVLWFQVRLFILRPVL